eukprot:scaffold331_cov117-Cylindrotheca_fusiformis.AAC.15
MAGTNKNSLLVMMTDAQLDCPTTQLMNETFCQSLCDVAGDEMFFQQGAAPSKSNKNDIELTQTCICGPYDPNAAGCNQCDTCVVTDIIWTSDQFSPNCQSIGIASSSSCVGYCNSIGTDFFDYDPKDGSKCSCGGVVICGAAAILSKTMLFISTIVSCYLTWSMFV